MKKIMKPFVLVAAAAMALASCQKNEIPAPEKQDVHFTINAGIETKTSIADNGDGTYSPSWKNGDQIGIFFTEPEENVKKVDATFSNTKEDGPVASFEGTATVESEGTFYAFYPQSAFNQHYGDETIRLDLPASQKPTSTSFDPACDILVAKPYDYLADGETVVIDDLYFARLMSVLRVNLKGDFAKGEVVESLTFSVDGVDITGNAKVDYKNATITAWNNGNVDRNVVTASYAEDRYITIAEGNNAAYLVVAPTTIPAGTSLSFTLKTANYNISKTVSAPSDMTFTAGNLSVLNLTIAADNCEKIDTSIDYSGEYLIAGKEGDKWYAAKKYTSGNYLAVSEIEFIGENIVETEAISDHYMTITKVVGGDYDGMYTIVDAGGKYLATSSSDSNYMKAESSASANTYWTIVKDDAKGTYSIVASKSDYTRNDMRFNYNSGTNSRVSCYDGTKTAQPYLALFSTSLVKPDTTPKLELGEESIELTAAGGNGTIDVTAKNLPTDIQVRALTAEGAQAEVEWLTAAYVNGVITYTAEANESTEERTAYIEVYVSDDLKTGVSVTQEGKPAEGAPVEITDVLTRATTGVTKNTTSYSEWSGKTSNSEAVYAGQSAGGNDAIQLRSNNNNSGVVTTTSGGKVKKIKVTWQSATASGRTLDIYGKNTAYTAATDLYNTSTQGTKLGSIKYGTSTELEISGDYEYIGLRSNSGAMYLTEIAITWETSGSGGDVTPDPEPEPEQLEMSAITCSAQTENSLTFTWTAVANATGYEVTCNNKTETVTTTQYVAANLAASTSYTISVVAKGNGTDYLDSEPKTQTGTTKDEQGGDAAETSYVKVTATPSDWSGTYLIVYESGATAYVYNGTDSGANNYVSATISDNQIARSSAVDAVAVQIAKSGSGYSIKVPNGKYISGGTSNGTTFNTSAVANTITLNTNGTVKINNNTTTSFQFNSASDQMRFRYFKSAQKSVYLYKLN